MLFTLNSTRTCHWSMRSFCSLSKRGLNFLSTVKTRKVIFCFWQIYTFIAIFRLKVNYGQFIKLERLQLDISCGGRLGVVVSETINLQGVYTSGMKSGPSKFASKRFCRKTKMPPFVTNDVQLEIEVNYAPGDKFQIGYKSVPKESY